MKYLVLFLSFLKIGAVSFGGGYGMISLVRETVLEHGWLTEEAFLNFIAVAESTPGPLAVNMATFVGAAQGGIFGAFLATFGVVLPSFLIILGIVALVRNLLRYAGVRAALDGIRPTVIGLITATAVIMLWKMIFGTQGKVFETVNLRAAIIFLLLALLDLFWKKQKSKHPSPVFLIAVSALLGILFYVI